MEIQTTKALKVYLSDISPHSQAILEFFIGSSGGSAFELVSTSADAQAYITDFDFPGSKEHWEAQQQESDKPCIALSVHDPENPAVEWVAKPITAKALLAAADKISKDLSSKTTVDNTGQPKPEYPGLGVQNPSVTLQKRSPGSPPGLPPRLKPGQSPLRQEAKGSTQSVHTRAPVFQQSKDKPSIIKEETTQEKQAKIAKVNAISTSTEKNDDVTKKEATPPKPKSAQPTVQTRFHTSQERWDALCGDYENIATHTFRDNEEFHYNSENYFQGTLIAGLRLAKQTKQVVQIKYAPHQFYVCFDEYMIFSPLSPQTNEFAKLCNTKVKAGQVNLHILTGPESSVLRKRIKTDTKYTYNLESFIWTSSLLTSKGRIPNSIDLDSRYLLKYWPNFTRIENFPFAMKIAAQWQKKPYTVTEIASNLNIPLRYVVAFVNGAISNSLFETDTSKIQKKSQKKPAKKNGLIARLFGRLTRSEAT